MRRGIAVLVLTGCQSAASVPSEQDAGPGSSERDASMSTRDASLDRTLRLDAAEPLTLAELPARSSEPVADCAAAEDLERCQESLDGGTHQGLCRFGHCVLPGSRVWLEAKDDYEEVWPPYVPHTTGIPRVTRVDGEEPVLRAADGALELTACLGGLRGVACDQGSALTFLQADAVAACAALEWAGHDDWYLPDLRALLSIVDVDTHTGIDATLLRGQSPGWNWLWTSSLSSEMALVVKRDSGTLGWAYDSQAYLVCARLSGASQPLPSPRFDLHEPRLAEPIAYDPVSRVMWALRQTAASPHAAAQADCEALSWAGHDDWRLPVVSEVVAVMQLAPYCTEDCFGEPIYGGYNLWTGDALQVSYAARTLESESAIDHRCVRGVD